MKAIAFIVITILTRVSCKEIDVSCLKLSDDLVGQEAGQYKSNMAQLINSQVSDQMRLHAITTCTNKWDDVTGIQFTLATEAYTDEISLSNERIKVQLGEIGNLEGDCETIKLNGAVDEVQVSIGGKYIANGIQSVTWIRGDRGKSYGARSAQVTKFNFSEDKQLIGVYGKHNDYGIQKLGFISYDATCARGTDSVSKFATYI